MPPDEVAEKYGVMLADPDGRITDFVEKPTLAELREHFHVGSEEEFRKLPLMTNAGFYLMDTERVREICRHPDIEKLRQTRLDFGKDLLPWLVGNGHPVYVHPVRKIGDLGNVRGLPRDDGRRAARPVRVRRPSARARRSTPS